MGLQSKAGGSASRFAAYVEAVTSALGHADRVLPFQSYCAGLLLPGDRKSVEPMAARVQPGRVQATHQSLHHFVAKSDWSDEAVLAAVQARILPVIQQHGSIRALIIDDTGMPKKGRHSVGVAVLRATWQAGQLPGGGEPVGCQRSRQSADRLPPVSASGVGR